ncbi:hypothetical protein PVAP13_8KG102201 [Panicum virgatum]|uniref:Uncharacterized protein n=1 Tax=Panicum virgatum TaxID=38727 RepID=A0A8T0PIX5_PANVG|nr:hypothetical protein PVAP13_8KG102201 [Panicum virgatum]
MTCGPHVIFSLLPLFSDHPLFSPAPPRLPLAASPSAVPQRCCRPHHPPLSSTSAGGLAPCPSHLSLPVGCLFLLLPLAADARLCGSAEVVVVAWDVVSSSPSKPAPASDMTRGPGQIASRTPISSPAAAMSAVAGSRRPHRPRDRARTTLHRQSPPTAPAWRRSRP